MPDLINKIKTDHIRNRFIIDSMIILIIGFSAVFIFSASVPFNMDEVYQYHALAVRHYPLNTLNMFREWSSRYDLAVFGKHFLPLRSFHYTGSFPCLLYYPLFRIWPSPYSARFLGIIMLYLQSILLYKLFKTRLLWNFLFLLAFAAYSFQHIADMGPVSFQTTSVFLIYYLLAGWAKTFSRNIYFSCLYPICIGLLLFLCVWTKIAFFFIMPGIICFSAAFIISRKDVFFADVKRARAFLLQSLTCVFSFLTLSFLLFNAIDRGHKKYFAELLRADASKIDGFQGFFSHMANIFSYLLNPLKTAHRIFDITQTVSIQGVIIVLIITFYIHRAMRLARNSGQNILFLKSQLVSFALSVLLIAVFPKAWAMHHLILAFPFLCILLFELLAFFKDKKILLSLFSAFIAVNLTVPIGLAHMSPKPADHPSKTRVNDILSERFSKTHVFVVIDWGYYYIKALYGDREQCVLYIDPLNSGKQIELLKAILDNLDRKALFIGRADSASNLSLITSSFGNLKELDMGFDTGLWRVWYE